MRDRIRSTIGHSVLLLVAVGTFALPRQLTVPAAVADSGDTYALRGVIRDFRSSHEDFEALLDLGPGHYAGNVVEALGPDRCPVFNGSGGGGPLAKMVRVNTSLELSGDSSILGADVVVSTNSTAADAIDLCGSCRIEGDALAGPGGDPAVVINGTVEGTTGALDAPWPMTPFTAPDDSVVGPSVGSVTYSGGSTTTIVDNMHFDDLRIATNAIVYIGAPVVFRVDGKFTTETGGSIVVLPGGSLELYALGNITIKTKSSWSDPSAASLRVVGAPEIKVETEAEFFGSLLAPEAYVLLKTKSKVHGSIVADALRVETASMILPVVPPGPVVNGFKVLSSWRDADGREIAPHMLGVGGDAPVATGRFAVAGNLTTKDPGTIIDGYDASAGPYGPGNSHLPVIVSSNGTSSNIVDVSDTDIHGDLLAGPGADPATAINEDGCSITGETGTLDEAVPLPSPAAPTDMGGSVGDRVYDSGTFTLSGDLHCDKFSVDKGAVLRIDGVVRILAENEFKVADSAIELLPGATLSIWTKGNLKFEDAASANANTEDPSRFLVFHLAGNAVKIDGGSEVHAFIEAPAAPFEVTDSQFHGRIVADEATIDGAAGVHIDVAGLGGGGCLVVSDTAGTAGGASAGGITSGESFSEWFDDVPGTNQSKIHAITMTEMLGVFEYAEDEFHPIDDALYGNEGNGHNHHFTYAIEAEATYEDCGGQWIEFEGNDDLWLFVNDRLVLDLGGMGEVRRQRIELDRLGLTDGETVSIRLFHAQRLASSSVFRLRTNVALRQHRVPTMTAAFD